MSQNTYSMLNAEEQFHRKRVRYAISGMLLALVAGVAASFNGYFNNAVQAVEGEAIDQSNLVIQIISILAILGILEFSVGIIGTIINLAKGKPISEYGRLFSIKSTRIVLVNALISGPVGTAALMIGCVLCGTTYTYCINAMAPLFAAIGARIFLKEKVNSRVLLGIVIVVTGVVITCIAPPTGVTNFYLGIFISLLAPICFATESLITGKVLDISDSISVCSFYRCFGSGILDWVICIIIAAATGNMGVFKTVVSVAFSSQYVVLFMVLCIIGWTLNYLPIYTAIGWCGAARAMAIQNAAPIWTIPVGLLFAALGIAPYNITTQAIIAAFVVVVGVVLMCAKPSELFSLRNIE